MVQFHFLATFLNCGNGISLQSPTFRSLVTVFGFSGLN